MLIVVLGSPRSGTSLVSGLLVEHGVWAGECRAADERNPRGYFENVGLRALRVSGRVTRRTVKAELAKQGYDGGPWLVKHTPGTAHVWAEFDPIHVCVRRDMRAVLASRKASRTYEETPNEARDTVVRHIQVLERIAADGGLEIWPDRLMHGDWSDFVRILDAAGLTFDRDAAEAFLDRTLWHH